MGDGRSCKQGRRASPAGETKEKDPQPWRRQRPANRPNRVHGRRTKQTDATTSPGARCCARGGLQAAHRAPAPQALARQSARFYRPRPWPWQPTHMGTAGPSAPAGPCTPAGKKKPLRSPEAVRQACRLNPAGQLSTSGHQRAARLRRRRARAPRPALSRPSRPRPAVSMVGTAATVPPGVPGLPGFTGAAPVQVAVR